MKGVKTVSDEIRQSSSKVATTTSGAVNGIVTDNLDKK